jgi:PAS domain S-box-containing protein
MNDHRELGTKPLRLLIVEDSEDDAFLLAHHFRHAGYALTLRRADSAASMRAALQEAPWNAVLSDHSMPGFSGLGALKVMQELGLDLPFIIVSGVIEEETAVAAMRAGAHDYLNKGKLDRLVPAVEREIREARHRAERRAALEAVRESEERFRALVANIPGMVFQFARPQHGLGGFLYVSDGSLALLGVAPEHLTHSARNFVRLVVAEDRPSLADQLRTAIDGPSSINWDGRILTGDGDLKWISVRSSPRRIGNGAIVWDGVVFNITYSKQTEQALRESREQLAELSSHLQHAKEEERERIARDIHDELGGMLVAIKFAVAGIASRIPADAQPLRERVRSAEKLTDEAINVAGRVARELRPGILKEFGLAAALECHAEDFTQRTGIACDILAADADIEPDMDTATTLYRVFQEALTNVNKHSGADMVTIGLYREDGDLVLDITDNGRGISPPDLVKPKSFGLRGMRERLNSLSGRFEVQPVSAGGTRVTVRVPLRTAEPAAASGAAGPGDSMEQE